MQKRQPSANGASPRSLFVHKLVPCFSQRAQSLFQKVFFDQHVIGVVGGDREDRNCAGREWANERAQDACLRKRKRSFEFQACPAGITLDSRWNFFLRANYREFIVTAGNRGEGTFARPDGNRCASRQLANCENSLEPAKFEWQFYSLAASSCTCAIMWSRSRLE